MRFSSPRLRRGIRILTGIGLIAWLWLLMALVAFVAFDRDTPALLIVSITLALWAATLVLLGWRGRLDLETGLYLLLTLALLVGLYMLPLRDDLPREARALAREIADRNPDDRYAFARELFWTLPGRFTGPTREYLLQPQRIFLQRSASYYWETGGYVPSHLLAQLYRHLLIDSGRFEAGEVRYRTGRCFNSPHGYVEIDHPERIVYADIWAAMAFEEYRFGQVVDMPSCDGITSDAGPAGEPLPE